MLIDPTDERRRVVASRLAPHTCLVALVCLAYSGGCSNEIRAPANGTDTPPDFALNVLVRGQHHQANALRWTSRYILEADRTLRAMRGVDAIRRTFPPITARLGPAQVKPLARLVDRHHLMTEPTSPLAEAGNGAEPSVGHDVIYEVEITSNGRVHRYRTTPAESPPTVQLVAQLAHLAGPHDP